MEIGSELSTKLALVIRESEDLSPNTRYSHGSGDLPDSIFHQGFVEIGSTSFENPYHSTFGVNFYPDMRPHAETSSRTSVCFVDGFSRVSDGSMDSIKSANRSIVIVLNVAT